WKITPDGSEATEIYANAGIRTSEEIVVGRDRVYWSTWSEGVHSIDLNGNDYRHHFSTGDTMVGLGADRRLGQIFATPNFHSESSNPPVYFFAEDGSTNGYTIASTNLHHALAVDPPREMIYIAAGCGSFFDPFGIVRVPYPNDWSASPASGSCELILDSNMLPEDASQIEDIFVDSESQKIYFTSRGGTPEGALNNGHIWRIDLDGSNLELLARTEFHIHGLVVDVNRAPHARDQVIYTYENTPVSIDLDASDPNVNSLTV